MARNEPVIHLISIPTPFPVGPVNVYLLEGDPLTLLDAGPLTDEAREALQTGLGGLGYALRDVEQLVITHAHHDHFGQARRIVEESGATLLSSRENRYPLEEFDTWWEDRIAFVSDLVIKEGAPVQSLGEMDIVRGIGQYAAPVAELTPLDDGDEVRMGGATWQALHTPGHALGHLCFYHQESRLLLSGDHLLRDITSNPVLETPRRGKRERPRSLPDYIQSLRRVRDLDVERALPGHGAPVHDHREHIDSILTHHAVREALILQILREGDRTVYELGVALFGGELPGVELFLVMSEIIGHLDILELEGKIRHLEQDGRGVWTAIHPR
ncbi:MAG TPA: MBL fold metallo-hydrolase [Anaerolineae bacterium]|nr:MBL fold metallo-hydrolase [Anaerolineae bacterium]